MFRIPATILFPVFLSLLLFSSQPFQAYAQTDSAKIELEPKVLNLNVGDETKINARVVNANGEVLPDTVSFFSRARRSLAVTRQGDVKALAPGSFTIMAIRPPANGSPMLRAEVTVHVAYPPLDRIVFAETPQKLYEGTTYQIETKIYDKMDFFRDDLDVSGFTSSSPEIAEVDKFGTIHAKKAGRFTLTASIEGISESFSAAVVKNPVTSIEINTESETVRTGDVITIDALAKDKKGEIVDDAPFVYSFTAKPDDDRGSAAPAQINQNGKFVANKAGYYTLSVRNASTITDLTVRVNPRNVQREVEVVGHGAVTDVPTSDLWIWEGVDGRDYAVTGTHVGRGEAFFWDVTDPANMTIIDTVTVDARVVNDVKVSDDGRIAVITREGASNRKNGLVILNVTDPSDVEIISRFDDGLTGGVHNVFLYEDHVYAINNGRRYDIINIEDPANPYRVSQFELETPGHAVHDVWVVDGIAYSSNWTDGVVAVDVGSNLDGDMQGIGGSPENPVELGRYTYPSGWNHAAFPFKSESTGKFYIVAGDEAFPGGVPAGWIHFFELDDWGNAKEVARYEVPEAGTHNLWIEDDVMYVAYYQGGLRVVDISGELMGNLYDQGREIARFLPKTDEGRAPNTPMAWGPQPYKGLIYVSDMSSGLWALRLKPADEEVASAP